MGPPYTLIHVMQRLNNRKQSALQRTPTASTMAADGPSWVIFIASDFKRPILPIQNTVCLKPLKSKNPLKRFGL
jgi:hypothetical protein